MKFIPGSSSAFFLLRILMRC